MAVRKTSVSDPASFFAIRRSGIGWLQVMMAGCGSRADISIDGGTSGSVVSFPSAVVGAEDDPALLLPVHPLKKEDRFFAGAFDLGLRGRNVNGRLA
mgnify:CR=1 FL=1